MLSIIIFSYNRAMQLDALIRSINSNISGIPFEIVVIFHCSNEHIKSYDRLMLKHYASVSFLKREKDYSLKESIPFFFKYYKNIFRFFKYPFLRKNVDNFKKMFENNLKHFTSKYVMFFTDDAYVYSEMKLVTEIFDFIDKDPSQNSFKALIGDNILGFSPCISFKRGNFYEWNYYNSNAKTHWSYPFAVDGTIYNRNALLNIFKNVLYHSPISLEAFVVEYVKHKRFFKNGLSPIKSSVVSTVLNRVSEITNNFALNIEPDYLCEKYMEGYELVFEFHSEINQTSIIPDTIFLKKELEMINLNN